MKSLSFRPKLTECEDRLTPASAAQIFADLSIVQADANILRTVYEVPAMVTSMNNEHLGQEFMSVIAQQSAAVIPELTQFAAELQSQIAANPALGGVFGAYVGAVDAAIVTAQQNASYAAVFEQVIIAQTLKDQAYAALIAANAHHTTTTE